MAPLSISPPQIRSLVRGFGDHLLAMQKPDGSYHYEYHPFTGNFSNDNNVVRQIGTMYSMAELHELFGDEMYLRRLKKTAEYWLKHSETMKKNGLHLRYFPERAGAKIAQAKMGSNALFVIGVDILYKKAPRWCMTYKKELKEVENFVLWMQKKNGGFAKLFMPSMSEKDKDRTVSSEYFDGEGLLALLKIYDRAPSQHLRTKIYAALTYLEKNYSKIYKKGLYLWAMTLARLAYKIFKDERFVLFADLQEELHEQAKPFRMQHTQGNNATILEGLANWILLRRQRALPYREQEAYLKFYMANLAQLQLQKSTIMMVGCNGLNAKSSPFPRGIGGLLTSLKEPVQRIDYQQHAISAYKAGLEILQL